MVWRVTTCSTAHTIVSVGNCFEGGKGDPSKREMERKRGRERGGEGGWVRGREGGRVG